MMTPPASRRHVGTCVCVRVDAVGRLSHYRWCFAPTFSGGGDARGGLFEAFVAKLDVTGSTLLFRPILNVTHSSPSRVRRH